MRKSAVVALLMGVVGGPWLGVQAARADEPAIDPATGAPVEETPTETQPVEPAVVAPVAETPVVTEEPAEAAWYDKVVIGGLVDTFMSVPLGSDFRTPSSLRVFDGSTGTFQLAYTELNVTMPAAPVGFRLDLGFGPVADLTHLETFDVGGMPFLAPNESFKNIQQAYVSFKLPWSDKVTIDVGKFVTTSGAEVIEAKDNWLYSRSVLFGYAIPFTHTGLRAAIAATAELTLQLSMVNGWDVTTDNNDAKTFGLSAIYAKGDTTAVLTVYGGDEGSEDIRILVDLVLIQKLGEKLTLNLNGDFGSEGDVSWFGAALMARYAVSDKINLTLRAEHFQDPDGFRTGIGVGADGISVTEVTVGAGFPIGGNLELRAEGRVDIASEDIFGDADDLSSSQPTLQLAALAWF